MAGRLRALAPDRHSGVNAFDRRDVVSERNGGLLEGNALKLGLFGPNCSGGIAFTRLPERWDASWENNLRLAQLAESAGLECMVPVARWKGFGGATNVNATSLETITWACGLLAHTRHMTMFGTVHVPMIHPIVAAKQIATVDHVGHGRFGVNIVCGWNQDEFDMFGMTPDEHDDRYARGEEWWRIARFRRPVLQAACIGGIAVAVRQSRSPDDECRGLAGRPDVRDPQLGSAFRLLPHAAGQRRTHLRDQAAGGEPGTQSASLEPGLDRVPPHPGRG
jgi:hypothetical protein